MLTSAHQVKLPAEAEDMMKRPAYIRENDAGVPICENRYFHNFVIGLSPYQPEPDQIAVPGG
jgi:hypothetical protein